MNSIIRTVAAGIAIFALTSCDFDFLDDVSVGRAKDKTPPTIRIASPADGFQCANIVEIVGTVTDRADSGDVAGKVASLSYAVPGSTVSGSAAVGAGGSFSFQMSTTTLGANFTLTLTAVDWNGNRTVSALNLRKVDGNSLPSFEAAETDRQIVLTWDAVPNTQDYTLYYTSNGSLPSDTIGTAISNVTSPYTLEVENGKLYTFRLKASARPGWTDSFSDYIRTIPLSERTLVPRAYGKRGSIMVEWNGIEATDQFTIYRRVGETGTFDEFRTTTGTSFTDTTARNGRSYYYRIRPAKHATVFSRATGAQTDGFDTSSSVLESAPLKAAKVENIFVHGDYLFGSSSTQGMAVFDAREPKSPRMIAGAQTPGKTVHRTVVAPIGGTDYAFAAAGADGLYIYDVADPGAPVEVAVYKDSIALARGVAVSGNYALVVDFSYVNTGDNYGWAARYSCTLAVLDVSDPRTPVLAASFPIDEATVYDNGSLASYDTSPIGIAVDGNYAYIAERGAGLRVVEWTDGYSPAYGTGVVGTIYADVPEHMAGYALARSVVVNGRYAYVAIGTYGLMVVDVSMPASPSIVRMDGHSVNGRVQDLSLQGNLLFTANLDLGVQIYRLENPAAPQRLRNIQLSLAESVAVKGMVAYARGEHYRTQYLVDLNLPIGLAESAFVPSRGLCADVVAEGSYAYLADGSAGLRILDVSDPSAPIELASIAEPGYKAERLKVFGQLAFVQCRDPSGFYVLRCYDVALLAAPRFLSEISIPYCRGYAVSGGYLYATDYHTGLVVYDVNNPADPVYIKRIATPFLTNDIAVSGGYAYVADEAQGAMVYNLMDPVSIFSDISIPFGNGQRLCATDKGLFSANEYYGAAFCDIGNPNDPASVKTFDFGTKTSRGIATVGNYAFVNNHRYEDGQQLSVAVIDVGRVAAPFLLTELDTAKQEGDIYSNGIAVSGAYLYQAVGDGLRIFSMRP